MAIKIKDLTHKYNEGTPFEKTALKNINIHIKDGTFLGIIGHTGSGKSTLIQMFNGLLKPTTGQVFVKGIDIHSEGVNKKQIRQSVGLVFQYPEHQFFEASVLEDVCFGPKNKGYSAEEAKKTAERSLKDVGVPKSIYKKSPFEISGGLKRRVAIAGVLSMEPDVLILDEPTAGLDPRGKKEILGLISDLHKSRGITVILVSHSMEDIAEYTDRLIVLNKGKKAFDGMTSEVFSHYRELEKMGLSAPQVTYVMNSLKERGLDVDTSVITVEKARESILGALRRRDIC